VSTWIETDVPYKSPAPRFDARIFSSGKALPEQNVRAVASTTLLIDEPIERHRLISLLAIIATSIFNINCTVLVLEHGELSVFHDSEAHLATHRNF
jgi:hypothetical protein